MQNTRVASPQKLVILRGFPGDGKSELAKSIAEDFDNFVHVENDQFLINENGVYVYTEERRKVAMRKCHSEVEKQLIVGNNVVVSNCFLTNSGVNIYSNLGLKYDCEIMVICCVGNYRNIHQVPQSTIKKMKEVREFVRDEYFYVEGMCYDDVYCSRLSDKPIKFLRS